MKETILLILTVGVLIYVGLCIFLYFAQRSFLYQPTPEVNSADIAEIRIASNGESIKIWHLNAEQSKAIIYFGGNAENVYWNIPEFKEIFPDYSVYLVNYRGYGGSSGSPTEAGLLEDAVKIFDMLRSNHESISVIGRSLGTGIATYLASVRDIEKMVLVTPFDSIVNIARRGYPIFPVSLFLKDRYDSVSRARLVRSETLIIVAENDEIILRENSERLISAFKASNVLVEMINDANHNSVGNAPQYSKLLNDFL
jgi:alpha/beta superfamily hydrolase